jgi:hypothetical protein
MGHFHGRLRACGDLPARDDIPSHLFQPRRKSYFSRAPVDCRWPSAVNEANDSAVFE